MLSQRVFRAATRSIMQQQRYHIARSQMGRILATDGVDEICIKIFQQRGHQVDFLKTLPESELVKIIGDYDGLVVRSATKVGMLILLRCASWS